MSLNSVVNRLVRAAASVPADISDTDLDSHVARLLAEEGRANDAKWSELGLGAFVGSSGQASSDAPDPSLPKTNKRFLSSIIKAVDGHNSALLRQQAESSRSAQNKYVKRNPRLDDGKRGASRLFGSALGRVGRDDKRESTRDPRAKETEPRATEGERRELSSRRSRDERDRRRHDSDSDSDRRHRRKRDRSRERHGGEQDRDRRSRRHGSDDENDRRRERHSRRRGSRSRSRERKDDDKKSRSKRHRSRSRSPKRSTRREDREDPSQPRPPSESPPPAPPSPGREPLSRMDKYFKTDYDPRLDFAGVEVPKSGPVTDFGWDSMLSVLKERGKKRRRNSPGLSASPEPVRKTTEQRVAPRVAEAPGAEPEKSLMDMEYTKHGQMRAWDVGK